MTPLYCNLSSKYPHNFFCSLLAGINDDLSKKSPHFREKYLVLSYLRASLRQVMMPSSFFCGRSRLFHSLHFEKKKVQRERNSNLHPLDRKPLLFKLSHKEVDDFGCSESPFVGVECVQAIQIKVKTIKTERRRRRKNCSCCMCELQSRPRAGALSAIPDQARLARKRFSGKPKIIISTSVGHQRDPLYLRPPPPPPPPSQSICG